ncbi:MAG: phosphatidate cytidylyltransferase [Calditerrivibrio sp.]|nr:phosphatidate cytidylyltransferase [Calditerrivibrio sp.]
MSSFLISEKIKRIITALILIPPLVLAVVYLNHFWFFVLLLVFVFIATYEFSKLIEIAGGKYLKIPTFLGAFLIPFGFYLNDFKLFLLTVFMVSFASLCIKLLGNQPLESTFTTVGITFLNIFYVPFFFSFIMLLRNINYHYIFYLFIIIFSSDTFAYFFGIRFGKRRLYELISPKKSLEGFVAGLIGGVAGGVVYSYLFMNIDFLHVIVSTVLVVFSGVLGDLTESMFKRKAGVKDSGNIFPGHGGMLDRVDALLFGAPVLYFYVSSLGL